MPDDNLQNKYEAQFQIAVLQRLDLIIVLLDILKDALVIPEDFELDDDLEDSDKA